MFDVPFLPENANGVEFHPHHLLLPQMVTKKTLNQKVTIGNMAIPFAILVVGIILALITLLLEIFADKICGKVRHNAFYNVRCCQQRSECNEQVAFQRDDTTSSIPPCLSQKSSDEETPQADAAKPTEEEKAGAEPAAE